MQTFIRYIKLICAGGAAAIIIQNTVYGVDGDRLLSRYYKAAAIGDYENALNVAGELFNEENNGEKETALFLAEEISSIPDYIPRIIEKYISFGELISNKNSRLDNLYRTLLMRLYAGKGDYGKAAEIRDALGFIKEMKIIGPFDIRAEQNFSGIKVSSPDNGKEYLCRVMSTPWYDIEANRSGCFILDALYARCDKSVFIAEARLTIDSDGRYRCIFGRSGKIAVEIDNIRVYESDIDTVYFPAQTELEGFLKKGDHRLRIYITGNNGGGCAFSAQVRKADGIIDESKKEWSERKWDQSESPFVRGYLLYRKGMYGGKNQVKEMMDQITPDHPLIAYARYYSARAESDPNLAWRILSREPGIIDVPDIALERFKRAVEFNMIGEIDRIEKESASRYSLSPVCALLSVGRALASSWYEEAIIRANGIRDLGYPIVSKQTLVSCYREIGAPDRSLKVLADLFKSGMDGNNVLENLEGGVSGGLCNKEWIALYERAHARDGYGIRYHCIMAGYYCDRNEPEKALPLLSAALRKAPCNDEIIYLTGRTYLLLGKKELAQYWFEKSVRIQPDNSEYRLALAILSDKNTDDQSVPFHEYIRAGKEYHNEPSVCLENKSDIEITADGNSIEHVRQIYLVNNADRANFLKTKYLVFDGVSEIVDEIRYAIIRADGNTESRDFISESLSDPESRIYYDLVAITVRAPKFKNGDILVFEYRKRTDNSLMKGYFGERIAFDTECRTVHAEVSIKSAVFPLYWKAENINPGQRGSGTSIVFKADNIPSVEKEPQMGAPRQYQPAIRITSVGNLREFHSWYGSRIREQEGLSPAVKKAVQTVCMNKKTDEEKIQAIYTHITERIRYTGFETGLGGYVPRKGDETYFSGVGDCKDIAFLLAQALRSEGLKADMAIVLTRNEGETDTGFVSLDSFNHALCKVECPGGKIVYLDGTVKGHSISELPDVDRDVNALVISEKRAYFEKIQGTGYIGFSEKTHSVVEISENLSAVISREVMREGPEVRATVDENLKSGEEKAIRFWNRLFPGAVISDYSATLTGNGMRSRYTLTLGTFATSTDGEMTIPSHIIETDLMHYTRLSARVHPIVFDQSGSIETETEYKIPRGYAVQILPADTRRSLGGILYETRYTRKDSAAVVVSLKISFTRMTIPRMEYEKLKKMFREISRDQNTRICFVKEN
jgi:tetratricopeptide (TPR) repeat protein